MKYIPTFESFLNEGYMSELDLLRQESASLAEFIKKAKAEFPHIAKMKDVDKFLKELWDISDSMNESVDMIGNIKVEKMTGGWKLSTTSAMGRGMQVVVLTDADAQDLVKIITK